MLAECNVARKAAGMRPLLTLLLVPALLLAPQACRPQPEGPLKAVVIGGEPKLRDPALGPLPHSDAVLLQNVAQGLVRFDASGNIVGGLAERWNVSDDGLSYIFRIASKNWPDGTKITAQQVARLLKRQLADRSRNPLKDSARRNRRHRRDDRPGDRDPPARARAPISLRCSPNRSSPSFAAMTALAPSRDRRTGGPGGEVRLSREIAVGR